MMLALILLAIGQPGLAIWTWPHMAIALRGPDELATGCDVAYDFDASGFVDLRDAAEFANRYQDGGVYVFTPEVPPG